MDKFNVPIQQYKFQCQVRQRNANIITTVKRKTLYHLQLISGTFCVILKNFVNCETQLPFAVEP